MTAMINGKFFDTTEVSKLLAGFPIPSFDVEALIATQRKNLEALTQANQLAVEGFQALAKRQVELTRAAIDEASALVRGWAETGTPEEKLQKHAAFTKKALAKGVTNTRELVELAGKTQSEAFDVLNKRFSESIDELAALAKKEPKKAARQ
jgi:phasin family protein